MYNYPSCDIPLERSTGWKNFMGDHGKNPNKNCENGYRRKSGKSTLPITISIEDTQISIQSHW
jgi:hypothetical protein